MENFKDNPDGKTYYFFRNKEENITLKISLVHDYNSEPVKQKYNVQGKICRNSSGSNNEKS
jgi:hypothetical protein